MNTVEEKLRRSFGLIARAESDSDLLGVGLLTLHSALEDHLRGALSNHAAVDAATRQRLIRREVSWATLSSLAQQHLGLTEDQGRMVLEAQEVRRSFIHGNPFRWRLGDVLRYGRLVETWCGMPGMLDEMLLERGNERRTRQLPATPAPDAVPEPTRWGWNLVRLAIMLGVLGAIAVGLFAGYRWLDRTLLRDLVPPPAAAVPTLAAAPAAASPTLTRQGRVVNLGSGPGWLHEQPSFNSATRPIRLSEGDAVTLLDVPPIDAEGTTWQQVEIGGYQGWSPVNNIAVGP